MKPRKPQTKYTQAMGLIAFAVGLYALVNHLSVVVSALRVVLDLLEPLTVGLILAFFLNVPMRGLEKFLVRVQTRRGWKVRERANATVSLVVTYAGGFLLIFLVLYIVIPQLFATIKAIITSLETAWPELLNFLHSHNIGTQRMEQLFSDLDLTNVLSKLVENYAQVLQSLSTVTSTVTSVAEVLTVAITGFVISIYILGNKKKLLRQVRQLLYAYVRKGFADKVVAVAALINQTFSSFISGQCVEALILGCMFFVAMTILRLPYALVISVFIAFMALIPYIGAFLGCCLGVLLIVMDSPMKALIFLVMFFVLQQLEGQLIYPKVVGSSVGLPPVWILASVFVGGKLFGVVGMLFFIPLASVVYSLLRMNVNHRLARRGLAVDDSSVQQTQPEEEAPEA